MFTVCSFLCGIADSLPQLIIFRLLQGFFGGGLQPNQQSIILDTFPPAQRGAAFGVTAIATIVAPVLGPTLGGCDHRHLYLALDLLHQHPGRHRRVFLVLRSGRGSALGARSARRAASTSSALALIALGLGCLQIMLDRGEDADWFGSPLHPDHWRVLAVPRHHRRHRLAADRETARSSISTSSRTAISRSAA